MKTNVQKILLLSVFATHLCFAPSLFASQSAWQTNCDIVNIHNDAGADKAKYLTPVSTNRAIIDSLGKDPNGDTTVHEKLDNVKTALNTILAGDVTDPSNTTALAILYQELQMLQNSMTSSLGNESELNGKLQSVLNKLSELPNYSDTLDTILSDVESIKSGVDAILSTPQQSIDLSPLATKADLQQIYDPMLPLDTTLNSSVTAQIYRKIESANSDIQVIKGSMDNIINIDSELDTVRSDLEVIQGNITTINTDLTDITNNISVIGQQTARSAALALTVAVDNTIKSYLKNKTITDTVDVIFSNENRSSGQLTNGDVTIKAGARLASLFGCDPEDVYLLTPGDKLSLVFQALFGITQADFTGITGGVDDSGVILTKVFDHVLGTDRDGTNGTNIFSNHASSDGNVGVFAKNGSVTGFFNTYAAGVTDDNARLKILLKKLRIKGTPTQDVLILVP